MLHLTFSLSHPAPTFNPHISLSCPDHLVINTGHHIHIINVTTLDPPQTVQSFIPDFKMTPQSTFAETLSEVSESMSEHFDTSSVVDAIIEDFNEYEIEGSDSNKPFHELNISCEPLNVTGKNYHNSLVQNIIDSRIKHLHNLNKERSFPVPHSSGLQKNEKSKVDKNIAEKAYEFTEENEKCEKLSLFRKKRLADKKYEFSEDNSENIVPFYSLRRERRYLYRSQHSVRSPDCNSPFLSPRSPALRSPIQSPNSRNGQFSPLYAPNFMRCSKSPISPRESSESDSRLILRHVHNLSTSHDGDHRLHHHSGLLIVDTKREETPKWIKKVVRRYSSIDFENSSLLSGQSRG